MESTKMMNNIKPAYAVKLGTGLFAGANWRCTKCGKVATGVNPMPLPQYGGKCPDTNSGNHVWAEI